MMSQKTFMNFVKILKLSQIFYLIVKKNSHRLQNIFTTFEFFTVCVNYNEEHNGR